MNIDITPIIQAFIALLAAIITYKLIPWIKARTTNEQQAMLSAAIKTAVFAAEQMYGAGNGEKKLGYAIEWLNKRGFDADREEIEAAVMEQLNSVDVVGNTIEVQPVVSKADDSE